MPEIDLSDRHSPLGLQASGSGGAAAPRRPRHSWGEPLRALYKTERQCRRCGLVKVTHHDNPRAGAWVDWWRDDVGTLSAMPACELATAEAAPSTPISLNDRFGGQA